MASNIFCPVCHRKNSAEATQCTNCGTPFSGRSQAFTTRQITKAPEISWRSSSICSERLPNVSDRGIAFFIANDQEPVIVEAFEQLFIGRQAQGTGAMSLDLTRYHGEEHGVSRQHAQIVYEEGVFTLIDLGSTNGTWLNQRRLTPGRPYQLHSDDHVLLGQLTLVICLHADSADDAAMFYLRDVSLARKQQLHLTPKYMAKVIIPYLHAIVEMQKICEDCRDEKSHDPGVLAISSVKSDPVVIVNMEGVGETVQFLQKWVIPWRKRAVDGLAPELKEPGAELDRALSYLAKRILSDLAPTATKQEMAVYHRRLLPPLTILATGRLLFSS